jgi:hypothetical protein
VDRAAHLRIGLDDPKMVTAPDFELWTRALRAGCRFHVLAEPLTYYRVHDRGVTHGDPAGTFLELSYATLRNLVPLVEEAHTADDMAPIVRWLSAEASRLGLDDQRLHRLLGMALRTPGFVDFTDFATQLASVEDTAGQAVSGRRLLAALATNAELAVLAKLNADLAAVSDARDFWHDQAEALTVARDFWHDQAEALTAARDFWHQASDAWEERCRSTSPRSPLQRLLHRITAGSRSPGSDA